MTVSVLEVAPPLNTAGEKLNDRPLVAAALRLTSPAAPPLRTRVTAISIVPPGTTVVLLGLDDSVSEAPGEQATTAALIAMSPTRLVIKRVRARSKPDRIVIPSTFLTCLLTVVEPGVEACVNLHSPLVGPVSSRSVGP